ncbi:hypothetical protein EB796_011009 [Bugula neritina]|uniref:SLC18B1 n=1 Tax=Bugula neritina TaxID=10212 RepID=A0A7J7JWB2_BUGNE|nr:hypothetical protein EB796_011009 [Bugula neritina]
MLKGYGETVIGLGVTCGPAIGGGLFKLGGFMTVFGGVGALIVMSTVLTWFLLPRDSKYILQYAIFTRV